MTRDDSAEAGLTLVELIIAMMLALLALSAITTVLVLSWTTQRDVDSVNTATNRGQTMGATIERAVRNALEFDVSADGSQLRVRTSLDGSLECQGFFLTDGTARFSQSSATLTDPSTWTPWQQGIARADGADYFTRSGDTVRYAFDVRTDSASVRFLGEAASRSAATGVSAPCW